MQTESSFSLIEAASSSTYSIREQLIQSFRTSKDYRHAFVEEKIRTGLAAQIKAMREQRPGLTQKKLGELLGGKSQSWVARLEDPNEVPPTLPTLLQVAAAFDVDLQVRFAPFSELVDRLSGLPHWVPGLSAETLGPPDFDHDPGLSISRGFSAKTVNLPELLRDFGLGNLERPGLPRYSPIPSPIRFGAMPSQVSQQPSTGHGQEVIDLISKRPPDEAQTTRAVNPREVRLAAA